MKTKSVITIRMINSMVSAAALLALGAGCATAQANKDGWPVISMKNDQKTVFAFENAGK